MATAVVSDPPRPRVVTSRSVDTPWNPATTGTRPSFKASRRRSARTSMMVALVWVVSVMIPAWLPVKDTASMPEVGQGHDQQGHRDPLPRGEEHVELPGGWTGLTSLANRIRSSVVLPMALTTTTTSSPLRRDRATWSATARMRSASPTEVPPNFWTTSGIS